MKTVSVISPCYNVSSYLDKTIGSILAQTRPVQEIVCADDGSTDDTVAHLERFGAPVKVIRAARNEGPAARRNDAFRATTGDYIAMFDPDDWWTSDHVEAVAGLLDRYPEAGVAFSKVYLTGASEGVWPDHVPGANGPENVLRIHMRNPVIQATSVIFRREVYDRIGPFIDLIEYHNGKKIYGWGGDYEWQLRAASVVPFVSCPRPTSYYFIRPGEKTASADKLVQIHGYRLAALQWIHQHALTADDAAWGAVLDRHRMAWAEDMERVWVRRELPGLRRMCRFGTSVPHLRSQTVPYLIRAWLGGLSSRRAPG